MKSWGNEEQIAKRVQVKKKWARGWGVGDVTVKGQQKLHGGVRKRKQSRGAGQAELGKLKYAEQLPFSDII